MPRSFVMWLLLHFRWSARMRNLAVRLTRLRPLQTALYWIQFILVVSVADVPPERVRGLLPRAPVPPSESDVRTLDARSDRGAGGKRSAGRHPYSAVVRAGRTSRKELVGVGSNPDDRLSRVREPDRSGLYCSAIQQVHHLGGPRASRNRYSAWRARTEFPPPTSTSSTRHASPNRVSANVSGFAGTLRISLNDNLLKRCTLPEIETTMGHEMGHYVLNHVYKGLVMIGVLIVIGFAFLNWGIQLQPGALGRKVGRPGNHRYCRAASGRDRVLALLLSR